jgi:hypothetical protein
MGDTVCNMVCGWVIGLFDVCSFWSSYLGLRVSFVESSTGIVIDKYYTAPPTSTKEMDHQTDILLFNN